MNKTLSKKEEDNEILHKLIHLNSKNMFVESFDAKSDHHSEEVSKKGTDSQLKKKDLKVAITKEENSKEKIDENLDLSLFLHKRQRSAMPMSSKSIDFQPDDLLNLSAMPMRSTNPYKGKLGRRIHQMAPRIESRRKMSVFFPHRSKNLLQSVSGSKISKKSDEDHEADTTFIIDELGELKHMKPEGSALLRSISEQKELLIRIKDLNK
jgi:hypothetical protein